MPGPCVYNNTAYPLHSAAAAGDFDTVKTLLANGADISEVNELRKTVLIQAIEGNQNKMVQFLIAEGADIHQKSGGWESTALHWAVRCENPELIRILLAASADANTQEKGYVALNLAPYLSKLSLEIYRLLLPHTDLTRKCLSGNNTSVGVRTLRTAVLQKNTAVARELLTLSIPLCHFLAQWMIEDTPELIPLALTCDSNNYKHLQETIPKENFLRYCLQALYLSNNVSTIGALVANQKRGIRAGIQPAHKTRPTIGELIPETQRKPSASLAPWPTRASGQVDEN